MNAFKEKTEKYLKRETSKKVKNGSRNGENVENRFKSDRIIDKKVRKVIVDKK
jgi:hypothetical protein